MSDCIEPMAKLTRREASAALKSKGYRVAPSTLAVMAVKGGGPPFRKFGRHVIYEWASTLEWAESRITPPLNSTAQHSVARITEKSAEDISSSFN